MKNRLICKRCHRIRVIKEAGYCESCFDALRAAERPKRVVVGGVVMPERDDKLCQICIDPIDKPHIDEDGTKRIRACPNTATRDVLDNAGWPMRVCEQHFKEDAS